MTIPFHFLPFQEVKSKIINGGKYHNKEIKTDGTRIIKDKNGEKETDRDMCEDEGGMADKASAYDNISAEELNDDDPVDLAVDPIQAMMEWREE